MSSASSFSVLTTSAVLAPGQSLIDTLRFTPAAPGSAIADIVIVSNASSSPDTLEVGGIGKALTGIEISQTGVADEFGLIQNYPNPFNPSTTIRYALPYRSTVRIEVFNVLGQVVADLINGEQSAGFLRSTCGTPRFPAECISTGSRRCRPMILRSGLRPLERCFCSSDHDRNQKS